MSRLYAGTQVALLTRHGKEAVIRDQLTRPLGARLIQTDAFDTDQLGTFTRSRPRRMSPLETARFKAQMAMELTGARIGMGSEGSYGSGPLGDLVPWNLEIVVWLDADRDLEVVGRASGPAHQGHCLTDSLEDAMEWARTMDFPAQALVIRPEHDHHPRFIKGINTWSGLEATFLQCQMEAATASVFLETDLRAHCSPKRMVRIGEAAADLLKRLTCICPRCEGPGFGIHDRVRGLPCRQCHWKTNQTAATIWMCPGCHYQEHRPEPYNHADPLYCECCNP